MTPQTHNADAYSELYPGTTYEQFGREFLTSNPISLQAFCMNERIDPDALPAIVAEIITEWQLREVSHPDRKSARTHMINHIRTKNNYAKRNNTAQQNAAAAGNNTASARMADIASAILRLTS